MGIQSSSNRIEYVKKGASASSQSTTSSIPISPLDIEVAHLETLILVWLNRQIEEDEQNQSLKNRLREHVTYLLTFNDLRLCEQWLKARPSEEKILLIVPGQLGKKLVPIVHSLMSIIGIYVFCWKPEMHTIWTQNYSKIRGVISKSETLIQQISKDQLFFENLEDSKSITIFSNRPHSRLNDPENSSFIWYQLFLEILISPSYFPSSASPGELISILRRYSSNDKEGSNLIKQFEQTYDRSKALKWLINNTPLSRFLNKALREQNISMLFYLRFFLIDIHQQLRKHQLQFIHVYRKQIMPRTDIQNIRSNRNNYLLIHHFLYTSTQPLDFSLIETNDNQFQTLFIEINAKNEDGTALFAVVDNNIHIDNDQNNSTVLFMCGAIFQINSLTENDNSSWILQLSLVGNKDLNLLSSKKEKLLKTKDLLIIVDLLDQSDKVNIYCQHLLRELPSDHPRIPQIKEKINLTSKVQPGMVWNLHLFQIFVQYNLVSLTTAQFILIDLSRRLSPLASAMLNALHSLTNDSIIICDHSSDIDFARMLNKTILLFSSSQHISSMTEKPTQLIKQFILEEDKNIVDQPGRFNDSEDLIFQLADELYRYYKWEANDDQRSGQTSTAKQKQDIAERIHKQLKKVHRTFSANDNDDQPTISTRTTIVWLKSRHNTDNDITNIKHLFENIVSAFSIFDDQYEGYIHVCTTEYNHFVFLIIDNQYKDISVAGFQQLNNVKQIYRYNSSSSSNKERTNNNWDKHCLRKLTHDLIHHYNQLGNESEEKNSPDNAKDMFLKAKNLCELIIQFCNI